MCNKIWGKTHEVYLTTDNFVLLPQKYIYIYVSKKEWKEYLHFKQAPPIYKI